MPTCSDENIVYMDLAFECKSLPLRVNEQPLLLLGFSTPTPRHELDANPLYLARHLSKASQLGISIYSLATHSANDPMPPLSIIGMSLIFSFTASRNTQSTTTPLTQISYDQFDIYRGTYEDNSSGAYEENILCPAFGSPATAVWHAFSNNSGPIYPESQLNIGHEPRKASPTFDTFTNSGAYFVTAILDVQTDNQGTVTFRADPEMIVGSIG